MGLHEPGGRDAAHRDRRDGEGPATQAYFRSAGRGQARVPSELAELFPRVVHGASPRCAGPGLHFQPRTHEGRFKKVAWLATSRPSQQPCEESLDSSPKGPPTTRSENRGGFPRGASRRGGRAGSRLGGGDPTNRLRRRPRAGECMWLACPPSAAPPLCPTGRARRRSSARARVGAITCRGLERWGNSPYLDILAGSAPAGGRIVSSKREASIPKGSEVSGQTSSRKEKEPLSGAPVWDAFTFLPPAFLTCSRCHPRRCPAVACSN